MGDTQGCRIILNLRSLHQDNGHRDPHLNLTTFDLGDLELQTLPPRATQTQAHDAEQDAESYPPPRWIDRREDGAGPEEEDVEGRRYLSRESERTEVPVDDDLGVSWTSFSFSGRDRGTGDDPKQCLKLKSSSGDGDLGLGRAEGQGRGWTMHSDLSNSSDDTLHDTVTAVSSQSPPRQKVARRWMSATRRRLVGQVRGSHAPSTLTTTRGTWPPGVGIAEQIPSSSFPTPGAPFSIVSSDRSDADEASSLPLSPVARVESSQPVNVWRTGKIAPWRG